MRRPWDGIVPNTKQASGVLSTSRKLRSGREAAAALLFSEEGKVGRVGRRCESVLGPDSAVGTAWQGQAGAVGTLEAGQDKQGEKAAEDRHPGSSAVDSMAGGGPGVARSEGSAPQLFDLKLVKAAALLATALTHAKSPPEGRTAPIAKLAGLIMAPRRSQAMPVGQARQAMNSFMPGPPAVAQASILRGGQADGRFPGSSATANPINHFGPIGQGNIANSGQGVSNLGSMV